MTTPRKSDLTHLEAKLDEFGRALAEVREMLAEKLTEIAGRQEQATSLIGALTLRTDSHDKRLGLLEAAKERAEGAAAGAGKVGRMVWAALVAGIGMLEWLLHRGGK